MSRTEFTEDNWFKTGDLGKLGGKSEEAQAHETYLTLLGRSEDRIYLTLVGRSKDLIITGGYNVYPKEVEGFLNELPGIVESAVIGVPDQDFGEAVVAVIVPKPGAKLDEGEIIRSLKTQIAGFKVPKRIHIVSELPRNTMGKVLKEELKARLRGEAR